MRIGLDMMGGDFAPVETIEGVKLIIETKRSDIQLNLIGDEKRIEPLLFPLTPSHSGIRLIHASQVIEMHEHPTKAFKDKPESSISIGFHMLREGKLDAFISAGNTGAMMIGALNSIKTIKGILRPSIFTLVPRENGTNGILLDIGLNADCKPENLVQFALLGSLYAKHILKIDEPKVGLLNIGEEEGKGNILARATYPLLNADPRIRFFGNIEGRDIFSLKVDVIVCDGFCGNVILKLTESFYDISIRRKIKDSYIRQFNFENYGGTPILGVSKPVIIGHGISGSVAFKNMILLAENIISSKLLGKIQESVSDQPFSPES